MFHFQRNEQTWPKNGPGRSEEDRSIVTHAMMSGGELITRCEALAQSPPTVCVPMPSRLSSCTLQQAPSPFLYCSPHDSLLSRPPAHQAPPTVRFLQTEHYPAWNASAWNTIPSTVYPANLFTLHSSFP